VWFDLVVPVHVLVHGFALVAFLFVDAVEAFQFPVRLGMVDAAQDMLDALLREVGFELANTLPKKPNRTRETGD